MTIKRGLELQFVRYGKADELRRALMEARLFQGLGHLPVSGVIVSSCRARHPEPLPQHAR
jgi:hypothetical protein